MSVSYYKQKVDECANNISIYEGEIAALEEKINTIVDQLRSNELSVVEACLNTPVSNFSKEEESLVPYEDTKEITDLDGTIDYSVTADDLIENGTIDVNGKKVKVYKSKKTDAIYVISSDLTKKEKKQLIRSVSDQLNNNQMAIVTYNGDYYHYDINSAANNTRDFSVVGKTAEGKRYAFSTRHNSEMNVDDGGVNDTLLTRINGMVLENRMDLVAETGTKLTFNIGVKKNMEGGQTVTEFTRLSFSVGSQGGRYANIHLDDDWIQYARINEHHPERGFVTVGANTTSKNKIIGHVDGTDIPVVFEAGDKSGEHMMQGTVCYLHTGNRPGHSSKDMLTMFQTVTNNWDKYFS